MVASGLTDEGLKAIAKAPALTHLTISNTKITGAGLPELVPMKKLIHLNMNNTAADNEAESFGEAEDAASHP